MTSTTDDLVELFDHVWRRFTARMDGLTDAEWSWLPTTDGDVGLRWRLAHIAELLGEDRNAAWLGRSAEPDSLGTAGSATEALAAAQAAFTQWRGHLTALDDDGLASPIGAPAGRFGAATRRSFVLHIADELIHHTAEAALLRDLYRLSR